MTVASVVERERRAVRLREMAGGALLAVAAVTLVVVLGALALGGSRWLALPRAVPFLVWCAAAAAALVVAWLTGRRLGARGSSRDVALAIESEQGMRRGALVGALELGDAGPLARRASASAAGALAGTASPAPVLRGGSTRYALLGGGAAVAALVLMASASPLFGDGLSAVLRPVDAWRGSLLARPRIEDAPAELLRGAPLRLRISAPGRRTIVLSTRQTGAAWRHDTLTVNSRTGSARFELPLLTGDALLVASDGRASSDSVVVRATDRPFLGALSLRVRYPAYLSRAPESVPIGEALRVPRGTVVSLAGRASVPLTHVALVPDRGAAVALAATGHAFTGRFVAEQSGRFAWQASGPLGQVADVPDPIELAVVPDSLPSVSIAAPSADTIIAADESVPMALTASDDHGLSSVMLRVARGDRATMQGVAGATGTTWAGATSLDVASLRLQPGESVRVRAEAVDASPWAQRSVSREIVVRRPTSEEQRTVARALGDSAVSAARSAAAAQQSLAQRTDEASRAQARQGAAAGARQGAAQKGQTSFEGAEKGRALAQEQRAVADRVEKLRQATEQLERQLEAAGALDSSLARQLGEAQALLRQAMTPEMMSRMQSLERAGQQMTGEQQRDALRDLAQMQQKMKEQLERSAEILKRAAHEGAMQTLGDEARELAAKERALADSAVARADDPQSADERAADARAAQQLATRAERLREQMESLKERLEKDKAGAGAARTERAEQHAAESQAEMRKAADEMRAGAQREERETAGAKEQAVRESTPAGAPQQGGRPQDGGRPQEGGKPQAGATRAREAADEMERAAQSMQDARAEQVKEWKQELTAELDKAVQEMLQMAREERALEQKSRSGQPGEDRRGAQSAVEQGVDKASERLDGAGRKSALLSPRSQRAVAEARQKVSQATQSITRQPNNGQQQANALGEAADALTRAAAALARDREKANSANSASGFSEMLQQMKEAADKQGQINAGAQSLMNLPNGSSSAEGQAMARALARQQRSLAEKLDDAGDMDGGDRAEQLAREARQLAEALDAGRLDATTAARQQQLFRRLLDAGKALEKEERDDIGKREARSGNAEGSLAPGGGAAGKAAVRFRPPTWEELRALAPDERRAILEYFTRLNSAPAP